jgi:hypothetical protein
MEGVEQGRLTVTSRFNPLADGARRGLAQKERSQRYEAKHLDEHVAKSTRIGF